jgi:hypothetical protein
LLTSHLLGRTIGLCWFLITFLYIRMFLTLITDCADANARGRQESRIQALFGVTPAFVGIAGTLDDAATLEASGNIIDTLDAVGEAQGIILANVAPRQGAEKRWGNGTPFGFFRFKNTLVVSTVTGYILSLPKKLGILDSFHALDTRETLEKMVAGGALSREEADYIFGSQFRSFDFLPRVAHWIFTGGETVHSPLDIADIPLAEPRVWTIDNFGNAKTTLCADEVLRADTYETRFGVLPVIRALKDVPDNAPALIVGSSGLGACRFAEIVVQGKPASSVLGFGLVRGTLVA